MSYWHTRYIVYIETKDNKNINPINDVSAHSLDMLLKNIWSYKWYFFRWIKIKKDDITFIRVYEVNFESYKKNAIERSEFWRTKYEKYNKHEAIVDFILRIFSFNSEVKYFGNNVTCKKAKYLDDVSWNALLKILWNRKEYPKDSSWKEIAEHFDVTDWKLIINEEEFKEVDEYTKSGYFLELFVKLLEKEERLTELELYDFVEEYEKINGYHDWEILNLDPTNIRNSYLKTINSKIKSKYSTNDMIKLEDWVLSINID